VKTLEIEILKEKLEYNADTGLFIWKTNGKVAGNLMTNGYITIRINGKQYLAHRLAIYYTLGFFPPEFTDHINGNRSDNRISNLRCVTRVENNENHRSPSKNNKVGLLGVTLNKYGKYISTIRVDNKKIYLGTFSTDVEAHNRYLQEKRKLHKGNTL
jgi:HNH endonuclease